MKKIWKFHEKLGTWIFRCPYCGHLRPFAEKPTGAVVCQQCKAIVDEETVARLFSLSKSLQGREDMR
jgi:transcription elongation factor Elf1